MLVCEQSSLGEVRENRRVKYLSGYLTSLGVKTIVAENGYTDGDYLDDYANYYVKCFAQYSRRCKRIHFFSREIQQADLLKLLTEEDSSAALQDSYLGFVVARPLPSAVIGRTVLATYSPDGGRRNYSCTKTYRANLFGTDLEICSLAFQEQDTVLAACATVALWCAFHKTADLFGTAAPSPAEITRAANRIGFENRPFPSHGLTLGQMCNAIEAVGLEPEVVTCGPNVPLISLIHAYLKFGIPVIVMGSLTTGGNHAVTINGYSIGPTEVRKSEGGHDLNRTGLYIDELYGHDDQVGPFARMKIVDQGRNRLSPAVSLECTSTGSSGSVRLVPRYLVLPVYHKLRLTYLDVEEWLIRFGFVLDLLFKNPSARFDTQLTDVNHFKREFRTSPAVPDQLQSILFRSYPRFIWRTTVSWGGIPLMELLFDGTAIARSMPLAGCIYYEPEMKTALRAIFAEPLLTDRLKELLSIAFYDKLVESLS